MCLGRIPDQQFDFGGTEIGWIDANDGLAGFRVGTGFVDPLAPPLDLAADFGKGQFDEFAYRAGFAGRQHEVVGRFRLQDEVHALDIILGVALIALGLEIAEIETVLIAALDRRHQRIGWGGVRMAGLIRDRTMHHAETSEASFKRFAAVGVFAV